MIENGGRVRARTRLRAMRRCGTAARCCSCKWLCVLLLTSPGYYCYYYYY